MQVGQRILICGSDDAEEDVKSVMTSLSQNEFLRNWFTFLSITGNGSWCLDVLIADGFRPDDRLVLLLGNKYGQAVSDGVSMPQFICQSAADSNIERLVFVKSTDAADERQKVFLDSVGAQVVRARYRTSSDAVKSVLSSLVASLRNEFDELVRAGRLPPYDPERLQDLICQQLGSDKKGETFDLNVSLGDLDQKRLAHFIEPANRYLQKNGRKPLTDLEFLKQHNFADADGRIYDLAFYLFAKTSFCSPVEATKPRKRAKTIIAIPRSREETGFIYTDDVAPDLADTTELYEALREDAKKEIMEEQKDAEKLKNAAMKSIRRIEESLERDLKIIESVEKTADDATIAKLTHLAFLNVYDEFKMSFVPTAKKYGDTDEPDYLDTDSLGSTLNRICKIRTRHAEHLLNTCVKHIEDLEVFIKHPMCVREDMLPDNIPESFMNLMEVLLPQDEGNVGKTPATKEDLESVFQRLSDETHREGRVTRKTIRTATAKPKKPKKKKTVQRGTSPFAGKGKIRGCIEVSAKCDAITVNGRLYDKITGYEVWERINRLLKPFSECDETPVPFTAKDRLQFHRGKAKQFLDNCVEPIKEGRKIVRSRIKPSLVPAYQREDEASGEAAKKPKFRRK